jgi:hypothetical protein
MGYRGPSSRTSSSSCVPQNVGVLLCTRRKVLICMMCIDTTQVTSIFAKVYRVPRRTPEPGQPSDARKTAPRKINAVARKTAPRKINPVMKCRHCVIMLHNAQHVWSAPFSKAKSASALALLVAVGWCPFPTLISVVITIIIIIKVSLKWLVLFASSSGLAVLPSTNPSP